MTTLGAKLEKNSKELRSRLWEAANILRGSAVDRTDWKSYILPLIFFKRISDVWDEEKERMIKEYGERFEDEHRFQIPENCHWNDIRSKSQNVGTALKFAMQEVERVNPKTLYRVFGNTDWGNKEKFSDELVKDLIEEFSLIKLGNDSVDIDTLGDSYEYLVGKFADVTRRNKAGEFFTPRSVVKMMVEILEPKGGESIYDPTCGTGGMLLAAIDYVKKRGDDPRTFFGKIYGQEKNLTTAAIARMNLFLHEIEDFHIAREDTLLSPAFQENSGNLSKFDVVLANPPFSLKEWGYNFWENDPWGRQQFGLPPKSYGDFAFVQHMIASLNNNDHGRMAVVLPLGVLYRKNSEAQIREKLLRADLIESIINLAPNLFYGADVPACIAVFRSRKPKERRNKVLFIDAQNLYRKGRAQNFLDTNHKEQIIEWYTAFKDVKNRVKIVSLDEIQNKSWTLSVSRYVFPDLDEKIPSINESISDLKKALEDVSKAEKLLQNVLNKEA